MHVRSQKDEWKEITFGELLPKKVEEKEEENKPAGGNKREEYQTQKLDDMDAKCGEFQSQQIKVNKKLTDKTE